MLKHNFRQLKIWSDGVVLAKEIYLLKQGFSGKHRFGLASQMYRAVVSIPSNIAEGTARGTEKDFARFLKISLGSAFELETQLTICHSCQLINAEIFNYQINVLQTLQKQISSFIRTVEGEK